MRIRRIHLTPRRKDAKAGRRRARASRRSRLALLSAWAFLCVLASWREALLLFIRVIRVIRGCPSSLPAENSVVVPPKDLPKRLLPLQNNVYLVFVGAGGLVTGFSGDCRVTKAR
jgi:hypothetical protein